MPEMSKKYGVTLGVMNSAGIFLQLTVDAIKMIAVGRFISQSELAI